MFDLFSYDGTDRPVDRSPSRESCVVPKLILMIRISHHLWARHLLLEIPTVEGQVRMQKFPPSKLGLRPNLEGVNLGFLHLYFSKVSLFPLHRLLFLFTQSSSHLVPHYITTEVDT